MLMGFLGLMLLQSFALFLETLEEWRVLTVRKTKRVVGFAVEFGIGEMSPTSIPP
jgi:hypothetical protein